MRDLTTAKVGSSTLLSISGVPVRVGDPDWYAIFIVGVAGSSSTVYASNHKERQALAKWLREAADFLELDPAEFLE